jgi:hypothetical protein
VSRANSPSKPHRSAQAGSSERAEAVGIDAPQRLNKRVRPETWPHPHPDNIALVGPREPFEGYQSVGEWLAAKIARMRARDPQTGSLFLWWGLMSLCDHLDSRVEGLARRRAGRAPVRPATIKKLRAARDALRHDLEETRPF